MRHIKRYIIKTNNRTIATENSNVHDSIVAFLAEYMPEYQLIVIHRDRTIESDEYGLCVYWKAQTINYADNVGVLVWAIELV